MVWMRWRPSVQCLPSACGAVQVDRCHSTRSRSRLADTWPPVRTTARHKTRFFVSGAAGSTSVSVAGCSPPLLGVGSIVVAAMVVMVRLWFSACTCHPSGRHLVGRVGNDPHRPPRSEDWIQQPELHPVRRVSNQLARRHDGSSRTYADEPAQT